ncbi:MAG: primosomal protein N' [Deltaproteobacteria bacterium]|jgi:primosomal protein N' (replication factor Y)|nr:primosomal protein N' [Deltaproteobacteria bacterium]
MLFAAEITIPGLPTTLYYALGEKFNQVQIGNEVTIKLGNRTERGWVISLLPLEQAEKKIKEQIKSKKNNSSRKKLVSGNSYRDSAVHTSQIGFWTITQNNIPEVRPRLAGTLKEILDCQSVMTQKDFVFFKWMSEYYGVPLADIIDNVIPKQQKLKPELKFSLTSNALALLQDTNQLAKFEKRSPKQAEVLKLLFQQINAQAGLCQLNKNFLASQRDQIKSLTKKNLVKIQQVVNFEAELAKCQGAGFIFSAPPQINIHQQTALNYLNQQIEASIFSPTLLFGVTGSGKTEIYIQAILKALQLGKSVLVIVPEIALTPQILDHFKSRLGVPIVVLHSQVGPALRWASWQAILENKIQVAIGARSAIFAPFKNLGLIIVDEEHDSSYKQGNKIYYHGRDVAVMKAKFHDCPVILGSATPSFESLFNVTNNNYKLLELPERATLNPLPQIELVDLTTIRPADMPSTNISPRLNELITNALANQEQVILLYNRRGFASYLQCVSCGNVLQCPNCSVTLTFHKENNSQICHYCGYTVPAPTFCPLCRNPYTTKIELTSSLETDAKKKLEKLESGFGLLKQCGGGTEKVTEELAKLFPQARIARLDKDAIIKKDTYRTILASMRRGEADILVGTQMIAKGHDLPNVTLVGIIDADLGLHFPDFRASEKNFQLITQASGRAGRSEKAGRVVIQTREPKHPTLVAIQKGNFKAFSRYELEYRKSLNYPPYGRLLRVIASSVEAQLAIEYITAVRNMIENYLASNKPDVFSILGPAPAPIQKIDKFYRWHILCKSHSAKLISQVAKLLHTYHNQTRKKLKDDNLRLTIDVDPMDML